MKKLFYISLGLFVVTLLFLGVYNFAFKNNPGNPIVDKEKRETAKQEQEKEFRKNLVSEPAEAVTDEVAIGAAVIGENAIGYFTLDGKIKKITYGGGGGEVLLENLPGEPRRALWSPNKDKSLVLLGGTDGDRWYFIDLAEKSVVPLKPELSSPTWTNLGDRIFYLYTRDGKTALNSAKPDGSDWKEFINVSGKNFYLSAVPKSSSISFWSRPNALEETAFFTFNPTSNETKKIFSGKYGANYLWSPDRNLILVSNTQEKGGSEVGLGIANQNGGEFHTIQVPTFIPKVTWSSDSKTIYYALPLSLPSDAILPNDYFGKSLHSSDTFWKMDVTTAKPERIIEGDELQNKKFDSTDLFLSPGEEYLFFTNRNDGKLYRIKL